MQTIDIPQLLKLSNNMDDYALGQDFVLGEASGSFHPRDSRILQTLQYPVRFDGYILFYLRKGSFSIDFNLSTYHVKEHSLLVSVPGNIISIPTANSEHMAETDIVYVLFSKEFMSSLHLDFNAAFQESLRVMNNPSISLTEEYRALAESYLSLGKQVLHSGQLDKRQIIGSLLSSLTYLSAELWEEQLEAARDENSHSSVRKNQILEQFIAAVTEHHNAERGMQFYADKLNLTPKYLSKIIKEASGRSGPEWIDDFVILEAKNLLRYSNMSIKEVVFALNFPNPSVFHKYFKAHTGQTPTEYRKGF